MNGILFAEKQTNRFVCSLWKRSNDKKRRYQKSKRCKNAISALLFPFLFRFFPHCRALDGVNIDRSNSHWDDILNQYQQCYTSYEASGIEREYFVSCEFQKQTKQTDFHQYEIPQMIITLLKSKCSGTISWNFSEYSHRKRKQLMSV